MTNQPLSGQRVLIVEDEMMIAMMLEDMLSQLGCTVAAMAANPASALAIIESQPIDAAVLDVNLDGQTSYGVAAALEERGIPFLFSTGYGALALDERYRRRRLLQKPFRQEDLGKALSAILAERAAGPQGI